MFLLNVLKARYLRSPAPVPAATPGGFPRPPLLMGAPPISPTRIPNQDYKPGFQTRIQNQDSKPGFQTKIPN